MEKKILFLAVMEAIPTIVCDTLYTLGLHDQIPSWKIMDNKGRITVVLHWEPEDVAALRSSSLPAIAGPSRQSSTCSTIASGGPRLLGIHARSISQVRFWDEFKVKKFQLPCLDLNSKQLRFHGAHPNVYTPTPWLTLLLLLGKSRVKQVKWNHLIQNEEKFVLVKEFLFHSTC